MESASHEPSPSGSLDSHTHHLPPGNPSHFPPSHAHCSVSPSHSPTNPSPTHLPIFLISARSFLSYWTVFKPLPFFSNVLSTPL